MDLQQAILSLVLAVMMFAIALDLETRDFARIARNPWPVLAGLLAQFAFLPVLTWLVTLWLTLPANIEAGMLLVACCPCGTLSNFVTYYGRGTTALSVSITGVANLLALFLTPFNFTWMVASNPDTADWLRSINVDPRMIWLSLIVILGVPLAIGLTVRHRYPGWAKSISAPLGKLAVGLLFAFIIVAVIKDRELFTMAVTALFGVVIVHNALGLGIGYLTATLMRLSIPDRRAVTVEVGMQNSGLALGIIGAQFNADLGMIIVASLWGIWHIVTGFGLAMVWRRLPSGVAASREL